MSFQTGLIYFDRREVPESQASAILGGAACDGSDPPEGHRSSGVFLAHAASQWDRRTPDGPQPYVTHTGAATFDGRLDNRQDLLLRLRDVLRGETSDAALARAAYERWGAEGLVHLIGDWSLAIWDAARKTVVLASDFAGVRPLYYCVQRSRVMWSTRLGPLVEWAEADEIDDEYVAGLLLSSRRPNRTPYRGVYSVPPGHAVRVTADGTSVQAFWEPPTQDEIRYGRESEYEDHLRALFREAVQCRLRTTAPVLSELSGGLDSVLDRLHGESFNGERRREKVHGL